MAPQAPTPLHGGLCSPGVSKSPDGGGNWTAANTGLPATSVETIVIDPQTPTTLYAGTSYYGVFKSTDGGGGWTAATTSPPTIYAPAVDAPPPPTTHHAPTPPHGLRQ